MTEASQGGHAAVPSILTFGFGYSLDTMLLVDIAAKGHGCFSYIPDSGFVGTVLSSIWLAMEILFNILDDILVMAMAFAGFQQHMDFFNASVFVGRVLKMVFQSYIEGFFF